MFYVLPYARRESNLVNNFGNTSQNMSSFRTDIIEEENQFVLKAELPGFKKEDIKIDVKDDILTIRAEHQDETEEKKDNYIRRERRYGSFTRTFNISNIKADEISADYSDGILSLNLPKLEEKLPEVRSIEIR